MSRVYVRTCGRASAHALFLLLVMTLFCPSEYVNDPFLFLLSWNDALRKKRETTADGAAAL